MLYTLRQSDLRFTDIPLQCFTHYDSQTFVLRPDLLMFYTPRESDLRFTARPLQCFTPHDSQTFVLRPDLFNVLHSKRVRPPFYGQTFSMFYTPRQSDLRFMARLVSHWMWHTVNSNSLLFCKGHFLQHKLQTVKTFYKSFRLCNKCHCSCKNELNKLD